MGKTPKDKHGVERRRPYNYPRNAQAQTQNSGTESRNYSYSTGNVPRKIPIYQHSVPYSAVYGPVPNPGYRFGKGQAYRGRFGVIKKPLKTNLNRQRRQDLRNKRVLSPRQKSSSKGNMEANTENQETVQETGEQVIKNGPEGSTSSDEVKEKAEDKSNEASNTIENDSNGIGPEIENDAEKIEPKSKPSGSKEKRSKRGSPAARISPKGKHSSKSKKDPKAEKDEDSETKEELELTTKESPFVDVKATSLDTAQTETSDTNDSIIEISIEEQDKSKENMPSTSINESTHEGVKEMHTVRDSPRRSTRLSVRQTPPPKPKVSEKTDSSSIIVLDSDESISILEISQRSQERSFAQSLRSLSGRPSLRTMSSYNNRSFNRPSFTGSSAAVHSNVSATNNDSENKLSQSKSGLWSIFHPSSTPTTSQDSGTDNEESTNRSYADESGNDSEATTEPPFEAASNVSFRKRKVEDAEMIELEQETKKIRGNLEKNSSGLLSMVSSPMNLFASKLRGEKIKSSTPVQLLERSIIDENADEDNFNHQDFCEEKISLNEKDDIAAFSQKTEIKEEANPRRWCNIM